MFKKFFLWYKENYKLNLYFVAFLFVWQILHLYWMTTNVVFVRLYGYEFWEVGKVGDILISLVDYTEIPALILGSLFYLSELQKEFRWKSVLFLIFLNSQWLHLFWITDEVVVAQFTGTATVILPAWLAWFAIMIDYLELPVIYDTVKRAVLSLRNKI
ncbi:hypothetical protein HZA26_02345 [Candidatus Nomurabacteria bacterium]|nr:hypothetical protein [Candidatus Nomurabacteria bacterium]